MFKRFMTVLSIPVFCGLTLWFWHWIGSHFTSGDSAITLGMIFFFLSVIIVFGGIILVYIVIDYIVNGSKIPDENDILKMIQQRKVHNKE